MSEAIKAMCPACGHPAEGNFCAHCGATLGTARCAACGGELSPGANFCHRCGASRSSATPAVPARAASHPSDRTAWVVAAILCVVTIAAVVYAASRRGAAPAPQMANAGNAVTGVADDPTAPAAAGMRAPDISNLTPREQFTRLDTRISSMLQSGDTTNVAFFMQMALQAYANLPDTARDVDIRYHAGMRQAQLGALDTARAQADTILRMAPNNLLAYVLRAAVANFSGDSAGERQARSDFKAHYAAEIAKARPEYQEHKGFLAQFLNGATP